MSGDELPSSLRRALHARGGTEPLEATPTDRIATFPSLDGRPRKARFWLVRTHNQLWLIAALPSSSLNAIGLAEDVAVGVGHPHEARIDRSLGATSVVVDNVRAALSSPQLAVAKRMLNHFEASAGGADYPFDPRLAHVPPPAKEDEAELAPGAGPFPSWWAQDAGGDRHDPWLFALETATDVSLPGLNRDAPRRLWIGVSGHRVELILRSEGRRGRMPLNLPLRYSSRFGHPYLEADGIRLSGRFLDQQALVLAQRLVNTSAGGRWATLAYEHLHKNRSEAGLALLDAAIERGYVKTLAEPLAYIAAAIGEYGYAASFLRLVIDGYGDTTDALMFSLRVKQLKGVPPEVVQTLLSKTNHPPAEPIAGAPWPPESPIEVWAAAAAGSRLAPELATAPLLALTKTSIRALQWTAAITQLASDWRRTAQALRAAGRYDEASNALTKALEREPRVEDVWLQFSWSLENQDSDHARIALESALKLDPSARGASHYLSATALHTAAQLAETHSLAIAPTLIEAVDRHYPSGSFRARFDQALRMRDRHQAHAEAGRMFMRIADAIDNAQHRSPLQPGAVRLEAAQAFLTAGLQSAALDATRTAVTEDFLQADVLRGAAKLKSLSITDQERAWWLHIANVLSPSERSYPGTEPAPALSPKSLASLYPAEDDWMSSWRTRMNTPQLPHRDQLIRGLERVEPSVWPDLSQLIAELSKALGIEPVPAYLYRGDEAVGISGWPTRPPVLLIGVEHLTEGPRLLEPLALRFALAVELAHIAAGHPILAFDDSILGTSQSVYRAFGRFAGTAETAVELVSLIPGIDQLARLQKLIKLSRRVFFVRRTVDKAERVAQPILQRVVPRRRTINIRGLARDGLQGTALAFRMQADRAALRLTGDVQAAVQAILATGPSPSVRLEALKTHGLASFVAPTSNDKLPLTVDESIRLASLLEDAAQSGPPSSAD